MAEGITGTGKRMGRPPCSDAFASAVLQNLIFGSVEKINEQARLTIEANVAYGLDIVKHAAREAQKRAEFQGDRKVQSYKFSSSWVRTWVQNMKLRRRRVTTTTKVLPPAEQVQEKMLFIQEHLIDFDLDEIISADETGFNYGALPLNQFVPCDADRATAPASDEKARFTAMLWGVAKGEMGSIFVILKCSAKRADLTHTRILTTLMTEEGFKEADGWTLKTWVKSLTLTEKKKEVTREYKVPYLQHPNSNIITIQHKAWMDTVRVCMWIDLQLGPHFDAKRGYAGLVWDNWGPHGVAAVKELASAWGISLLPLPPNMTDVLQVMDLVVNAPVKAKVRRDRVTKLYNDFQAWKIRRLQADNRKERLGALQSGEAKGSGRFEDAAEHAGHNLCRAEVQGITGTLVRGLLHRARQRDRHGRGIQDLQESQARQLEPSRPWLL